MKTFRATSASKSAIYPITVGGELFVIRDWGSDWSSDNKHFGIEELDPRTGMALSSNDINAEWFTVLEDQIFFRHEISTDLSTTQSAAGS